MSLVRSLLFVFAGNKPTTLQRETLDELPTTISAAFAKFNLDGQHTIYAVCEACHATYAALDGGSSYPEHCSNVPSPGSDVCGTPLLEDHKNSGRKGLVRPFIYFHLSDYLATLFAAHEELLDLAVDDCAESLNDPAPVFMSSVFDGNFVRTFPDPQDPQRFFVQRPGSEGRLLFAMNFDFFNVQGMTTHGSKRSYGFLSLACLNLPIAIRYKPENVWVTIIGGPHEPPLEQVNHYYRHLVEELLRAWVAGIYLSRTPKHPLGRLVRCAVALFINDMKGARKVGGLIGENALENYCQCCDNSGRGSKGRWDYQNWKSRDWGPIKEAAFRWRDAATKAEQEEILKTFGVRWTEFWRLPYFHPGLQLCVDCMHTLFLGVVDHHIRDHLGLSVVKAAQASKSSLPAFHYEFAEPTDRLSESDQRKIRGIHSKLLAHIKDSGNAEAVEAHLDGLQETLADLSVTSLRYVFDDLIDHLEVPAPYRWDHIAPPPGSDQPPTQRPVYRRRDMAKALVEWVSACNSMTA